MWMKSGRYLNNEIEKYRVIKIVKKQTEQSTISNAIIQKIIIIEYNWMKTELKQQNFISITFSVTLS